MSKYEIKELVLGILVILINFSIAFLITFCLGIQNTVVYHSYMTSIGDITYEIILFWLISIIEYIVYYFKFEINQEAR